MATLPTSGLDSADEHSRAVRRLEDAMNRHAQLNEVYQQSLGTGRELGAFMRLREARKEVTAFERWLHWVDDDRMAVSPPADEVELEEVLGH
ncbi:MAG TPA: hypothetical protein VGF74_14520 [Thermoleophilaceae bacterium]|jgi:hypothetical protein